MTLVQGSLREASWPYDYILIDCPPFLGAVTYNALMASDLLIMPTQAEFFSINALRNMMAMVRKVRSQGNPRLTYRLLLTMFDRRNRIHRTLTEQLRTTFGNGRSGYGDRDRYKTARKPHCWTANYLSCAKKPVRAAVPRAGSGDLNVCQRNDFATDLKVCFQTWPKMAHRQSILSQIIDQLSPAETAADEMLASAPQPDASTLTAPTIHSDPSNRIELTSPNGKATAGVPVQKNGRVKSNGTGKTGPLPTDPPASGGSNRNPTDTNHRPARQGFSLEQGSFQSAVHPWTETGARGLDKNELALMNATGESPAAIAMPLKHEIQAIS